MSGKTLCCIIALNAVALATGSSQSLPIWWGHNQTRILAPEATESNYSPANLGQLKHVATQAKKHLDSQLAPFGGAGSTIDALVASFTPTPEGTYTPQQLESLRTANYAPANLGQLKAVSKAFYDRLNAVHYSTNQNLIARGYPSTWTHLYAWNPSDPWNQPGTADKSINYAPVNLGQLKLVFSFDLLALDQNGGPPSWWKMMHFGSTNGNGAADSDGDGDNDLLEFLTGTKPIPGSTTGDQDEDGVDDAMEITRGTNVAKKDNPAVGLSVFAFSTP